MNLIEELKFRGYLYQCTDIEELEKLSNAKSIAFYIGFDCTAESLHVGSLLQIMLICLLQKYGHKPIILIGGGTTKIGDPSGKDEARKLLSDEVIEKNIDGIKKSLSKFIKFGEGDSDAIILNNNEWLEPIKYIEFLREYGREFSVNRMLSMESVRLRLEREQNLSFLEFNYMLLQAYDFMYLSKNYDCLMQLGGSDQWGNIVMGADLVRRKLAKNAIGLTTPLLTTASGAKMGKSASGAIWLNEDMLSPYDYFQYWRNIDDLDVMRFAKFFTEYNKEELDEFEELANSNINEAKKKLAHRLTELCHGKEEAEKAVETARKVFEEGGIGEDLPEFFIPKNELEAGIAAYELYARSGLCSSNSEARKLIRGGGARVNNEKISDENQPITLDYITKNGCIKLSAGKKKHLLVIAS